MNTKAVTLSKPVQRGDAAIASVTLREPMAGDLRGLNLSELLQMNVAAMTRLVPRITEPGLAPDEVANLPGADLVALSLAVVGFFFSDAQMAEEAQRLQ